MIVTDCLIKTLDTKDTKIYVIKNNNRYLLLECDAQIEIIRRDTKVDMLNSSKYTSKKYYIAVIVCGRVVYKQEIDSEYMKGVKGFEITTEVIGETKNYAMAFKNIAQIDTDERDDWQFEITDYDDVMKIMKV